MLFIFELAALLASARINSFLKYADFCETHADEKCNQVHVMALGILNYLTPLCHSIEVVKNEMKVLAASILLLSLITAMG